MYVCIYMVVCIDAGMSFNIYVVRDGSVASFLMDPYFDQQLPVIPADINFVDLTWESGRETVRHEHNFYFIFKPERL